MNRERSKTIYTKEDCSRFFGGERVCTPQNNISVWAEKKKVLKFGHLPPSLFLLRLFESGAWNGQWSNDLRQPTNEYVVPLSPDPLTSYSTHTPNIYDSGIHKSIASPCRRTRTFPETAGARRQPRPAYPPGTRVSWREASPPMPKTNPDPAVAVTVAIASSCIRVRGGDAATATDTIRQDSKQQKANKAPCKNYRRHTAKNRRTRRRRRT